MRAMVLVAACLVSGCAGVHLPPVRTAHRAPVRRATPVATTVVATPARAPMEGTAEVPGATVTATRVVDPVVRSAPEPGGAIPLMGFRPMRGQGVGS